MKIELRSKVKKLMLASSIIACLASCSNVEQAAKSTIAAEPKQPNILFIMSDDHTRQAIGAYGGHLAPLNPTPTIDALAKQGTRFDNVFVTNSICTPSRASIITGQYSQANGALDLDGKIGVEKQYLPTLMSGAGYETAMIGKWHLKKEPLAFDYYKVLPNQGKYFDPVFRDINGKGKWPNNKVQVEGHSSDVITDLTIEWLSKRTSDKPFFLMHHYKAPHDMFENAPRYDDYLADVTIPEPGNLYDRKNFGSVATRGENGAMVSELGTSVSKRNPRRNMGIHMDVDQDLSEHDYTADSYQRYLKRYLRTVKGVDDNLARLFEHLKANGQWENTVIIYTGDQGMMLGEHDLIDKRWMYEGSLRMPFIVYHPGKPDAPKVNDDIINNTDFAPFMLELAGVETPEKMHGKSFASTLDNETLDNWRTGSYYRYWMHRAHHDVPAHFGLRTAEHKLIFFYGAHYDATPNQSDLKYAGHKWSRKDGVVPSKVATPVAWEFYDLSADPKEDNNAYNDPKYKDIIATMKVEMLQQRQQYAETDVNYPHIQAIIDAHWND
ncbi:sulfatase [Thalassotalea fonticola]|uniref:Sulfatase n=1 Tax=Thalassotalea fonticola TaxID=3065649 RepID=A0ABZ0GIL7_9GAMM|nr:sulfatase [Colwelliaceae bacterium S1-1]